MNCNTYNISVNIAAGSHNKIESNKKFVQNSDSTTNKCLVQNNKFSKEYFKKFGRLDNIDGQRPQSSYSNRNGVNS